MAGPYKFSPSAGSVLKVSINSNFVKIAGCEGIPPIGPTKGTYETTAIDDLAKAFGDDLPDGGEITLTGPLDTTDPGQAHLMSAAGVVGAVDSFQYTAAKPATGTSGAIATFNGIVLSFQVDATQKKAQMFHRKVKLSGAVNFTPAV